VLITPATLRSPPMLRLFSIVTSDGRPIVIAAFSVPDPETVISFSVPEIVAT